MDMKKLTVWFIIWVVIIFILIPKPQRAETDIDIPISLQNVKEMVEAEIVIIKEERDKTATVSGGTIRSVPKRNTSMKSYMDYRKITNKSSGQYKLQQSEDVYTDEHGYRKIGDSFLVAVGSYYAKEISQELEVVLSTGESFKAVVGDFKADIHTDKTNRQDKANGSIVEFIVDTRKLESIARKMGDCSYSEAYKLKGDIVSIEVWESSEE